MTPQQLKAEIEGGPLAAVLAADWQAGRTGAVAARLNALGYGSLPWGVPWSTLATWAAGNGTRGAIEDHAGNPASPVRSICLAVLDTLRGSLQTTMLDLTSPATAALLAGLVAAGVMTAAQRAELVTIGTRPASRIEILAGTLGAVVTISDVDQARAL